MSKSGRNWLRAAGLLGSFGFISFGAYSTYHTLQILRKPLNTNCLAHKRSEYIYLKHDYFRAPVKDFMNELFQDEPKILSTADKINSFLYAIKKKVTLTKLEYGLKVLGIAKFSNDPFLRLKALRRLANLEDFDDWEFQYLAQFCDARTATSLARFNCNKNWFIRPREYLKIDKTKFDLVKDFRIMLDQLSHNECVQFVLDTTFAYDKIRDPDDEIMTSYGITRKENDLILQSLDALLHLSTNMKICNEIAHCNGLNLLLDIHKHFADNTNIKLIINKIVTNMTSCQNLRDYFHKSGWIYLLSIWQNDDDLRIQILASTALTNLDGDDHFAFKYPPKVYPLYPKGKYHKKPELDLIFVHGLLGGIFVTWRQQLQSDNEASLKGRKNGTKNEIPLDIKNPNLHNSFYEEEALFKSEKILQMDHSEAEPSKNLFRISEQATKEILDALVSDSDLDLSSSSREVRISKKILTYLKEKFIDEENYTFCWPLDWLPVDFPDIRILGLNYESALSLWTASMCPCEKNRGKLVDRSREFLEKLAQAKIGENRPVVWVGHSMGGLLIKYIFNQALQSEDPNIRCIGENTRGVMFLGTPHKGSSIAKLSQQTSAILWPTIEVQDLEEDSKELLKMNQEFLENLKKLKKPMKIVSIAEGDTLKVQQIYMKLHIVTLDSAFLGVGDFFVSSENHLNLSKPVSKNSFIYTAIVKLLNKIIADQTTKS